jgi:excisionase family DNA binding protein
MRSTTPSPITASGIPRLLKPDEAAEVLSVSSRTLWSLTKTGDVPAVRIGTQWRYDLFDLQEWIRSRKTGRAVKDGA